MNSVHSSASDTAIAACIGDAVVKGAKKNRANGVAIQLYQDYLVVNGNKHGYADVTKLAIFEWHSSSSLIYNEWSATVHFGLADGSTHYLINRCAWFKRQSISDTTKVASVLREKTFPIRLQRAMSQIQQSGAYVIPLEPTGTIRDDEGIEVWKAMGKLSEPPPDRRVAITRDRFLWRGDGYKVEIPSAVRSNRLWFGVQRNFGGPLAPMRFSTSSPDRLVASNEEINRATKQRIWVNVSFDRDVVAHIIMAMAR